MKQLLPLTVSLLFLLGLTPLTAQEEPAPDDPVTADLQRIEDVRTPADLRGAIISRLLAGGDAAALDGLRDILGSDSRPENVRLAVVAGVLDDPQLLLLDDLIALFGDESRKAFASHARDRLVNASPRLIRALAARAREGNRPEAERILVVDLLGDTFVKDAVAELIELWAEGTPPVDAAARAEFESIFPLKLEGAAAARSWWKANSGRPIPVLMRELRRPTEDGDLARRGAVERMRKVLEDVSLTRLIDVYLSDEIAEIRAMGAERLGAYPYAGLEGDGADAARARSADALLQALTEEDARVAAVAELAALRPLLSSVKDEDLDRAFTLVESRMNSSSREVKLAAVAALGDFQRRAERALQRLRQRYDALGTHDPECRLAILDAIERIGKGITGWVRDKLEAASDDDVRITVRLIQLLKKNGNHDASRPSIPTLIRFLRSSEEAQVRQEAASTLGTIGVKAGDPDAIGALAEVGLADKDTSVRVICAKQLGGAPEVNETVIERLRDRLHDTEPESSVRVAAARSLLKLRGASALGYLGDQLGDDAIWDSAVKSYISAELIAYGRTGQAAAFAQTLCDLGSYERTISAARMMLAAKEFEWEEKDPAARNQLCLCLAISLDAVGKPGQALQALAEVPAEDSTSDRELQRVLLMARLLRRTGEPEKVEKTLAKIFEMDDPPPGVLGRAKLELAKAHLELGRVAEALQLVKPLLSDPDLGEEAAEVERAALEGRDNGAVLIEVLDSTDPEKRAAAIEELKALGPLANEPLATWLEGKAPDGIEAAALTIAEITGISVPFDPEAPEETRKKLLVALRGR